MSQEITIKLDDETYIFYSELAILNNLPQEHFLVEAAETFKAYLMREMPGSEEAEDTKIPLKVH